MPDNDDTPPGDGQVRIRDKAGAYVGVRPMLPTDADGLLWYDGVPYVPLEGEPDTWIETDKPEGA